MSQIKVAPRPQKDLRIKIGEDNFEMHVSALEWTPTSAAISWAGGTPEAVFTDQGAETWAASLTGIQDWETPGSLAHFLLEHSGEKVEATFKPDAAGTFEITATVTLTSPKIGGAVNVYNEFTVALGSTKPVVTPVPAVPPVAG